MKRMKFNELPLQVAIFKAKQAKQLKNDPLTDDDRWEVAKAIVEHLRPPILFTMDEILVAWANYRKRGDKGELLAKMAAVYPHDCFVQHRNKGVCSEDVAIDRIVPGSKGGQYTMANCVLMCGKHNSQRGNKPLGEFIMSNSRLEAKCESS